jgi:hypothetical protein
MGKKLAKKTSIDSKPDAQFSKKQLRRQELIGLVGKHRQGYRKKPVSRGEFDVWIKEQVWAETKT